MIGQPPPSVIWYFIYLTIYYYLGCLFFFSAFSLLSYNPTPLGVMTLDPVSNVNSIRGVVHSLLDLIGLLLRSFSFVVYIYRTYPPTDHILLVVPLFTRISTHSFFFFPLYPLLQSLKCRPFRTSWNYQCRYGNRKRKTLHDLLTFLNSCQYSTNLRNNLRETEDKILF